MQDYNLAAAYVGALTGIDPTVAIIDFRALHDTDKARPGIPLRGALPQLWNTFLHYQSQGYGIFACFNEMDGVGRELDNVQSIRAQIVDLDNISAPVNYQIATQWTLPPSFAVCSSPGKFHVYWGAEPYNDRETYYRIQRKLRQLFDGDRSVIDPTRVLRVPGTLHLKGTPHLVTCHSLSGYGHRYSPATFDAHLANVNLADGMGGERKLLGEPSMSAPALEWCVKALAATDPNMLDRLEWLSFTSAFKQAAWLHAMPEFIRSLWDDWCNQYSKNDPAENHKLWESIRDTEVGWSSLVRRVPSLQAEVAFANIPANLPLPSPSAPLEGVPVINGHPAPPSAPTAFQMAREARVGDGRFLNGPEMAQLWHDIIYVTNINRMWRARDNRFFDVGTFNAIYGNYRFLLDNEGKQTDEAWKAATRSMLWTVPRVDHTRFLPENVFGEVVLDDLKRPGLNTYIKYEPVAIQGDVTPFLRNMELIIPNESDRRILFDYFAHNVKYPGFKIPWAPFIQSVEGVGKGLLAHLMSYCMGQRYTYRPKANDLSDSGAKFNAWMRSRLFIIVDEVKVDEERHLMEVLKPLISESLIEIQAKGKDQEVEDNYSNWLFFSNYKRAMPITRETRRVAPFFSQLQFKWQKQQFGMNKEYFDGLFHWFKNGGKEAVAYWFLNYPIAEGAIDMEAPITTSTNEALEIARGPIERAALEGINEQAQGFKGGWISSNQLAKRARSAGARNVTDYSIHNVMDAMGYYQIGRAPGFFPQEGMEMRPMLYNVDPQARIEWYGILQGY